VSQRVWFRSKIEAYLLAALIAEMPVSDRLVLPAEVYRELQVVQYVTLVPSMLSSMGKDKVFELRAQVQDLKAPADVWVRTAMIYAKNAVKLEDALKEVLTALPDLAPKQVTGGGVKVHVTNDAVAVFSKSPSVVQHVSLSQ
jgi:hypothetical protein